MVCKNCGKEVVCEDELRGWVHRNYRKFCWAAGGEKAEPLLKNPTLKTLTQEQIDKKGWEQLNMDVKFHPNDSTNPKDLLGDKKVSLGQVCPVALVHESMAMMDGSWKYGFRNYREKKVQARIYIDAALRHIQAWAEGEELAEDSGVHHLGHARACLGILLDAQESGNLIDNRVPGVFSKVLKKMETWVEQRKKHYETK